MNKFNKILFALFLTLLVSAGCVKNTSNNSEIKTQAPLEQVQVVQKVEGQPEQKTLNFNKQENKTALDLLKASYKVETKTFSGMGEFVESIEGVKPDNKHYWEFIVNDKSSNVGAGEYKLVNGDRIEWKLTLIK